jgi:hypothetical protein
MMKDNLWLRSLSCGAIHALSIYGVRTMGRVGALLGKVVSYIISILTLPAIEVRSNLRSESNYGRNA